MLKILYLVGGYDFQNDNSPKLINPRQKYFVIVTSNIVQ